MAFKDFPEQPQGIELLQRSLARGRLGHAYLFTGDQLDGLEALARTLAKTLNCQQPVRLNGAAIDCCDKCLNCRKVDHENHGDVFWVRPESRSRAIEIKLITRRDESPPRVLLDAINMKPGESDYKIAVLVAADRMTRSAANAFLKTLEEPPAKSVLILLSTEPQYLLETILSRCLRLNFYSEDTRRFDSAQLEWLEKFATFAVGQQKSLLGRYQLLDLVLQKLAELKVLTEESVEARSLQEQYPEAEPSVREQWDKEKAAAVEAENRHQRRELLLLLQWWLRDVWLHTLQAGGGLLNFPKLPGAERVAGRLTPQQALENLKVLEQTQRLLHTNVQEALALEVGLLKLHL